MLAHRAEIQAAAGAVAGRGLKTCRQKNCPKKILKKRRGGRGDAAWMEEMAGAVSGLAGAVARGQDPREAADLVARTADAWKAGCGRPGENRRGPGGHAGGSGAEGAGPRGHPG